MAKNDGNNPLGGMLSGLSELLTKLGELAEKGTELKRSGTVGTPDVRGVYGFTIRTVGGKEPTVQPFGNVKQDATGSPVVDAVLEPVVDVFEEADHVLVTAELPGIGPEDVKVHVAEQMLTIVAATGKKQYRAAVPLPRPASNEQTTWACRNGVLEVRLAG